MNKCSGVYTLAINVRMSTLGVFRLMLYPLEPHIPSSSIVATFTFPVCSLCLSFLLVFYFCFIFLFSSVPLVLFVKQLCINIFLSSF
jgi:hypothetical protein